MAVHVTIGRTTGGGSPTAIEEHPRGADYTVRDGHLFVVDAQASNAKHVAVYAPGQWASAVVVAD